MPVRNRPFELLWLEDFLELSRSGSFSRAARERSIAQPAFSRHIKSLEDWLGATLFDRSAHPVALTEAGRRFRPVAEEMLGRLALAREDAQAAQASEASKLRFAATHVLSLTFFPGWLRTIEARAPIGTIQLVSDSLSACEELMLAKRSQFLLCHGHASAPSRLEVAGFRFVRVGADVLLPVAAPDAKGRPCHSLGATTRPVPVLAYSNESGLGRITRAVLPKAAPSVRVEPVFTADLATVLKSLALEGRGIAWLPESLVRDDLTARRLLHAGGDEWQVPLEIRLFRRDAEEAAAAEAFWKHVVPGKRRT